MTDAPAQSVDPMISDPSYLQNAIARFGVISSEAETIVAPDGGYCEWMLDLRRVFMDPHAIEICAEAFWERFKDAGPLQVAGFETAAIPLVTAIGIRGKAHGRKVNCFYVRKERKRTGLCGFIEGIPNRDPVIVVDDLVNNAQTLERLVGILSRHDLSCAAAFAVVDYENRNGHDRLRRMGIPFYSICRLSHFGLYVPEAQPVPNHFVERWRFNRGKSARYSLDARSGPALCGELVIFGTDDGNVWAVKRDSGAVEWCYKVPGPPQVGVYCDPICIDGEVFVATSNGFLERLEADTGKSRGRLDVGDSISSAPAFSRSAGALFIKFGLDVFGSKGGVAAVDRASFEVVWKYHFERRLAGEIVHDDGRLIIVVASHGFVQALDFSGQVRWQTSLQAQDAWSLHSVSPASGVVAASSGTELVALDSASGEKLWRVATADALAPNIVWNSELLYGAERGGRLIELAAESGEQRRSLFLAEKIYSGPVAHGSHLYVGTSGGHVFQVDPRTFKIVGRFDCLERILNPIVSDGAGAYYVRTQENQVMRFDHVVA